MWGRQAAETLKEDSYYSFLTEEKRIEYVSELVKISESDHSFYMSLFPNLHINAGKKYLTAIWLRNSFRMKKMR